MSSTVIVPAVTSCALLSSTACPLLISTSQCTDCSFYITMSTAVFHILSTSVCTSHCTFCLSCVSMSTVVPYIMFNVGQCVTLICLLFFLLYPLLVPKLCPLTVSNSHPTACWFCQYDYCYQHSLHCLSETHNLTSVVCVNIFIDDFYILSIFCQYLTLYCLLIICH